MEYNMNTQHIYFSGETQDRFFFFFVEQKTINYLNLEFLGLCMYVQYDGCYLILHSHQRWIVSCLVNIQMI